MELKEVFPKIKSILSNWNVSSEVGKKKVQLKLQKTSKESSHVFKL